MNKILFRVKNQYLLPLIFTVFFFSGFQPGAKQSDEIVLHDERLSIVPKEFYIEKVADEREDRSAIAMLLSSKGGVQAALYPADLRGGAIVAIRQFIDHNLPANKNLTPVIIELKKFKATESAMPGGRVEGNISLVMSFDVSKKDGDPQHLAEYSGSARYIRSAGPAQDVEPTLRHLIENGLVYIDTWMNRQAGENIKLAKAVKVALTDFKQNDEGDTIYYRADRPLKWDDFQSKTGNSKYDAQVFPTIGYEEKIEVKEGIVNVDLAMKVSLPKSACWVKDNSRSDYTLNHEQRHFDIAKLVAEHFKQKLKTENLPVDNFDGPINMEYLETYREMAALQRQYDDETRHGQDQSAQQHWNEKIDRGLKQYGVK